MAEQGDWRDASTRLSREGAPDDTTWQFGFADAVGQAISPGDTQLAGTPWWRAAASDTAAGQQIVFIEGDVPDAQLLAAGVAPGVTAVILDPDQDGVQQIAAYLNSHGIQNLAAIDVVAHGADGLLQLGTAQLDSATIGQYQADLAAIGAALQPGGDIQLYGCDVAQNGAGDAFLQQLSQATGGANIAASSHLVGSAAGGGNWTLNVDVGTVDVASPFTAAAVSAYPDELSLTANQIIFATWNGGNSSTDDGDRVEQFGVSASAEIAGSTIDLGDGSQSSYNGLNYLISGIAVDTAKNEYFAAVDDNAVPGGTYKLTIQEGSLGGTGGVSTVYTDPLTDANDSNMSTVNFAILGGMAIDAQTNELYYAQAAENYNTGATDAAATGIYEASISGSGSLSPTLLTSISAGLVNPDYIALDPSANLLFFDDSIESSDGFPATDNLDEVNLSTGTVKVLESFFNAGDAVDLLQGLAINGNTLYLTTKDTSSNTSSTNQILSIPFTVSGSGSTATASVGTATTLYSGSGADQPSDIVINAAQGIFYTTGEQFINANNYYGAIYEGSLSGGSSLTEVLSMSTIITNGDAAENTDPVQLVLLTQPIIAASGTVTADSGGSAVTVDSGITVSDPDGQNLASATVTGALSGDTLSYNGGAAKVFGDGFTITSSFSGGTLTLSGNASPTDYQSALDAVTFSTTSTSATPRTIDWTVSDGVVSSATESSTVDVHTPPTVTAGATATFDGGGSPIVLDSGLTVSDASSSTLASASVTIVSEASTDRLDFTNQNGITGSYNSSNGVLTLTGNASVSAYQTALESITYSVSPPDSDPTDGGSDTSRTIDWTVNDGVLSSNVVTSTLDTVHEPPTVTAGGTATFDGGGSPATLDSSVTAADGDSGSNLVKATVVIGGYVNGDTLTVGTSGGLGVAFSNGTLTLSGTATIATYNTALESVAYGFTAGGDPTGGGSHTTRTISWSVNDGVVSSNTSNSTLDVVHVAPTVVAGGSATYQENTPPVILDAGVSVTDPDSGGNLIGATVSISSGFLSGDTLNFTDQNGISDTYDNATGLLTLSGTASIANYDTALDSITYSFSGDPTDGDTDTSRTISWVAKDGVLNSAAADSTLTTTVCFCAGTRIATERGEILVEALREGDRVVTHDGKSRPIVWIGQRRLDVTRHPDPSTQQPVRIRRGAIADCMPRRDLLVSPDHAVFLDGLLIPARLLVNAMTITREVTVRTVRYFHVELDRHAVLLAEGFGCESYLDTGNRSFFENGQPPMMLHPRRDEAGDRLRRVAESCAPFADDAARVEPLWRRLAERAGALGFDTPFSATTADPALHVMAAGRAIQPISHDNDRYVFVLPPLANDIRLVSRAAAPCDTRPWIEDRRHLGVTIRRIVLRRGAELIDIALDDPRLEKGWWAVEGDGTSMWRWTNGDAVLPVAGEASILEIHVAGTVLYPIEDETALLSRCA